MALDSKFVLSEFDAISTTGWKDPVRCATANTDVLPAYTRVGNVITANANGALPAIDGITLTGGDSVLLTYFATAAGEDAGIYEVTQIGNGGAPFILTRRADANTSSKISSGMRVTVQEGTSFTAATQFVLTTPNPIVLNTDTLTFTPDTFLDRFNLLWESTDPFGEWTGSNTIYSGAFSPTMGRIFQWSGTLGATAQLPDIGQYDHNKFIGLAEGSGSSAASLTITADASDYIFDAPGVPGAGNSIVIQGAWRFIILQADLGAGGWKVVSDRYRITSLPTVTAVGSDVLVIEDASDTFRKKKILASDFLSGASGPLGALVLDGTPQTSNFTASSGTIYLVSSATSLLINLPAAPANGDFVVLMGHDSSNVGRHVVSGNGNTIDSLVGAAQATVEIGLRGCWVWFRYDLALDRWHLAGSDYAQIIASYGAPALVGQNASASPQAFTPAQTDNFLREQGAVGTANTTGTQNDFSPADWQASWAYIFTGTGVLNVTGFAAPTSGSGVYEKILINNGGVSNYTLQHQSGSSAAANRIVTPDGLVYTLAVGAMVRLVYLPTIQRWYVAEINAVLKSLYNNANTVLGAITTGNPQAINVAANSFVGRDGINNVSAITVSAQSLLLRGASGVVDQTIGSGEFVGRPVGGNLGTVTGVQARSMIYPLQTIFDASANTTDATVTTIASFTTVTNSTTARFKFQIQALETATGDAALFDVAALTYRNNIGVVSVKDTTFVNGPFRDQAAWTVTLTPSGSTVNIQVTGEAAKTIKWRIFGNAQEA